MTDIHFHSIPLGSILMFTMFGMEVRIDFFSMSMAKADIEVCN